MRKFIGITLLILFCVSCRTHIIQKSSVSKTIQGYTYDRVTGETLIGTFISNLTQEHTVASDTIGRFRLTANLGDSILFKYVGMKDSVMKVSITTPSYLEIGLDTANTTLISPEIIKLKHISETDFKPFQIDNGDDYVKCDRYRIVDKAGRIGYANGKGYVIIEPIYAFASPYENGIAKVTDRGVWKEVEGSNGEYHYWESDYWYYIDLYGESVSFGKDSISETQHTP